MTSPKSFAKNKAYKIPKPRRKPTIGLTSAQASSRLGDDGPNALPKARRRTIFTVAVEVLREPMLLLLLAAGVIYLTLGDRAEAILIVGLASATVIISIVQQTRSERVLERSRK